MRYPILLTTCLLSSTLLHLGIHACLLFGSGPGRHHAQRSSRGVPWSKGHWLVEVIQHKPSTPSAIAITPLRNTKLSSGTTC
jgi:hypothetical protein